MRADPLTFLYHSFALGAIDSGELVAWADARIESSPEPDDWLFELANPRLHAQDALRILERAGAEEVIGLEELVAVVAGAHDAERLDLDDAWRVLSSRLWESVDQCDVEGWPGYADELFAIDELRDQGKDDDATARLGGLLRRYLPGFEERRDALTRG